MIDDIEGLRLIYRNTVLKEIVGLDIQPSMKIYYNDGLHMVFRINGYTASIGDGKTAYFNPVYYLIELGGENSDYVECVIKRVVVNRGNWRDVLNDLKERAKQTSTIMREGKLFSPGHVLFSKMRGKSRPLYVLVSYASNNGLHFTATVLADRGGESSYVGQTFDNWIAGANSWRLACYSDI